MEVNKLTKAIQKIYAESKKPVLLSHLGAKLAQEMHIEGKLRQVIEQSVEGFKVFQDIKNPERVAIAAPEDEEGVKKFIEEGINVFQEDNEIINRLKKLPRSLIYAFCKEDAAIYISKEPPFKFTPNKSETDDNYLPIEREYRGNLVYKKNLNSIDPKDLESLWSNIENWASHKQIKLDSFDVKAIEKPSMRPADAHNLLDAILFAIPERSHNRVSLPLDIIKTLKNTMI